jgi:ABC-type Fe3+/spermidine/putrescine transport system ATPase subunit
MIAGFIEPTRGDIFLNGARMTTAPPYKRGLGVVFQNYALFPHLSVFENLAFPLRVRRRPLAEIRQRAARALELVGLAGYAERRPSQLSGGQQQRVALARALVFDPPVLLMDEPLGALDKKLRQRLQIEIKELQQRLGITVIYVTHDQEEALVMSDRIVVMNRGRAEQVGAPTELYNRSANAFVADFIGESNLLAGKILPGSSPGECTVQVAEKIEIVVQTEEQWQPGSRGLIVLRPEDITLVSGPVEARNRFAGVIEIVAFVGDSTKYAVRVESGIALSVRVQRNVGSWRQGDHVTVAWDVAAGRLIKASDGPPGSV